MYLSLLKGYFAKFVSFLRKYSVIICVVLGLILVGIVWMMTRGVVGDRLITSMWKLVEKERSLHAEKTKEIDKIHSTEVAAREVAARRAVDAVKQAEEQYRKKNIELDEKKRKEIAKLVITENDSAIIAKMLAEQYGFTYIP